MLRNIFCWKGFGPVTGPPSFPGANFQQMVIARLSLGLSFLGLRNFLKLCHDEKPCTWWLGEKGLGSLQSRLARMLHHEYDALKGYRFLGGAISFYSVSCMSDVIFNPSLLNWSSLILTVAHIYMFYILSFFKHHLYQKYQKCACLTKTSLQCYNSCATLIKDRMAATLHVPVIHFIAFSNPWVHQNISTLLSLQWKSSRRGQPLTTRVEEPN